MKITIEPVENRIVRDIKTMVPFKKGQVVKLTPHVSKLLAAGDLVEVKINQVVEKKIQKKAGGKK